MQRECLLQTYSGRLVDPTNVRIEQLNWLDIGHALSRICRFNGHASDFMSVAEHSVYVSRRAAEICVAAKAKPEYVKMVARWGLIHDASEAYLGDVTRGLKYSDLFAGYRAVEKKLMSLVCRWADLPEEEPLAVHQADNEILYDEARANFSSLHPQGGWEKLAPGASWDIQCLYPPQARQLFLDEASALGMR